MKIGILTYHACHNYGACLQAFSLQHTIKNRGLDCKIIDFQTPDFININHPFSRLPKHPKEVVKNLTRLPYYGELIKRKRYFNEFINKALELTSRCSSERDVIGMSEQFDCVVCGSDQTWNLDPSIRYETPLYYMNFEKKQRRISYATSFGSWVDKFPTREKELLPWLKQFDALSMREESGVQMLQNKGLQCEWVLDPTLLLSQQDYDKIAVGRLIDEPYVLLFSWDGAKEAVEVAKKVSKSLRCRVYYIIPPPRAMFSGIERKLDVGPREFLSLVKYADFVVTNSFHGTVFSTIYNKPFISAIKGKPDPRRASLMKQLGLEDHLMEPTTINIDVINKTNFDAVEKKLVPLKKHSLKYLYNALQL